MRRFPRFHPRRSTAAHRAIRAWRTTRVGIVGIVGIVGASVAGCGAGSSEPDAPSLEDTKAQALTTYAAIVRANYADSRSGAVDLRDACDALVASPSQATLDDARAAWLAAREPYLQTEVFRFYDGPIDAADSGPEGLMNAWPLDEVYIDYVEGAPDAGIINDPTVTIDAETLVALNEMGGEKNIATGYHAVEFLLWGQDTSPDGPGDRPFTDYRTDGSGTAANQDRRGEYLGVTADLLVEHHDYLVAAWAAETAEDYANVFFSGSHDETLTRVFTGMYLLSGFETGGERLQPAFDFGDQEDEHSCFSDNTHRDFIQDLRGVQNVYVGRYVRLDGTVVEGTGLMDVLAAVDAELAEELDARIATSLTLAEAIIPPFDQEILQENMAGRQRLYDLIVSLRDQADLLEQAFLALDLQIPNTEPW
jgi:putative iron-regulated protein